MEYFAKINNRYDYCRKYQSYVFDNMKIDGNFIITGLIFALEVFIPCKKVWSAVGAVNFDLPFISNSK